MNAPVNPDAIQTEAERLLSVVAPDGPWALCAANPNDANDFESAVFSPGDPTSMREWIAARDGVKNIYLHVAVPRQGVSRAQKKDITLAFTFWVDVDPDGARFDESRAENLAALNEFEKPPSIIVDTGNGHQAFWLLEGPVGVKDEAVRRNVEGRNYALAEEFEADRCHSIEHLMRLPGTRNLLTDSKRAKGYPERERVARIVVFEPDRLYDANSFAYKAPPEKASEMAKVDRERAATLRITSPDDLDLSRLRPEEQAECRARVEHCFLPGEKQDASNALLRFCGLMVRAGHDADQIYAVATDDRHGISRHYKNKKHQGDRAVRRTIGKALGDQQVDAAKKDEAQLKPGEALRLVNLMPCDAKSLPPRPWLVEGVLMRGHVTMCAGFGGSGKSALVLALATSVALDMPWAHFPKPTRRGRALILNAEDDQVELQRRLSAHWGQLGLRDKDQQYLDGHLLTVPTSSMRLVQFNEATQKIEDTQFFRDLMATCRKEEISLLIADPLIELHGGIDENSAMMEEVHLRLRKLAQACDMAVLSVHHFRKSGTGGDQNSARGSTTLAAGARVVITVDPMTEKDAGTLLPENERDERWKYIHVETPKSNYGPRGGGHWFEVATVNLDPDKADGLDRKAPVLLPAKFNKPRFNPMSWQGLGAFLDKVAAGRESGDRFTKAGVEDAQIFTLLAAEAGISRAEAKAAVKVLVKEKVLRLSEYRKPSDRHEGNGYEVLRRPEPEEDPDDII